LFWWLLEKVNYFCFKLNFYLFLDWIVTMIAIINLKKKNYFNIFLNKNNFKNNYYHLNLT
jgi:hypothetical protein